ncbi:alpha-ketoglutarate-dependent dioxygenase alkB homolog 3 isoform X2 [Mobula hypostoma]|uniref:alpha-ketoglutarate-dependent dioxygenase alkB homolog 3 isoform X2 n=1 Tax=Mobula hypostoma TaxID=723540 RepID=UPI002FC27D92
MADKRQRARVQGSWAGHSKTATTAFQAGRRTSENVARTHWPSKEQAAADRRFVFQDPTEVQRKIPEERIIDKEGLYEISSGPTGISRLHLKPGFIESKEADWMFEQLSREIPWQQKSNIGRDGPYQEPRLTAWYGQLPYTYSGSTMKSNPHWHPLLAMLKDLIEELTGYTFNSLLCNLYRSCKDSIDWHSDDEPSLGRSPVIASLSFGETRNFEMRKKPPPEEKGDYTYAERIRIPLSHGCLLIMEGSTQKDWQHRVPKEYHDRNPRINLTFRTVYPEA